MILFELIDDSFSLISAITYLNFDFSCYYGHIVCSG